MKISNQLKKARKDKKLTQEYVASQINVSRKTISSWENGRGQPNSAYLKQLNSIYDTNLQFHYTQNHYKNNKKYFYKLYIVNLILFILCLINVFTGLLKGIAAIQFIFILFFCINFKINIFIEIKNNRKMILTHSLLYIFLFIIIMNNLDTEYTVPNMNVNIFLYVGAIIHSLILTCSFFIITNYINGQ